MSKKSDPSEFYATFSSDYDTMTRDASRWKKIAEQYSKLFSGKNIKRILDAGCGSGGESLALVAAGYEVTGVDATANLLEMAKFKAAEKQLSVKFNLDDIRQLKTIADKSVDALICRGNTLPHLLTTEDLLSTLQSFARVTTEGGLLLLQWLNYERILKDRKRLIGATGDDNKSFIRFYDFISDKEIIFNLIILQKTERLKTEWQSTTLRPWVNEDVQHLLKEAGWSNIRFFADIDLNDFDSEKSGNVVLLADRRG